MKIEPYIKKESLTDIIFLQNKFNLDILYKEFPEYRNAISSDGKEKRLVSSIFGKLSVFTENKNSEQDVMIIGLASNNKRAIKWINNKFLLKDPNIYKWKVIVSKTNNSGELGETLSSPEIAEPNKGFTQSFIGIGSFNSELEAKNALKYIKTKFARVLLGILKITQDNPPEKWKYVPLQDFSSKSDIDWSKSILEIDQQLYKKYGLDEKEIEFIETHVREME